jgi:hypothetical protein
MLWLLGLKAYECTLSMPPLYGWFWTATNQPLCAFVDRVWDKDTASDEYMGHANLILKPLDGSETKGNYDLQPRDPAKPIKAGKTLGYITVNVKYRSVSTIIVAHSRTTVPLMMTMCILVSSHQVQYHQLCPMVMVKLSVVRLANSSLARPTISILSV